MKRLTNKQLIKMIEDLAKEVAELKARPVEQHHHHHYPQPVIQPYVAPQWPHQTAPVQEWPLPRIWCTTNIGAADVTLTMHNDDDNASGALVRVA